MGRFLKSHRNMLTSLDYLVIDSDLQQPDSLELAIKDILDHIPGSY